MVADDGSEDDTAATAEEYVRQHGLDVTVYRNEQNGGKVGAISNAITDTVETPYVFLMDADSWLPEPDQLQDTRQYLRDEDLAAVGSRVVPDMERDPDRVQAAEDASGLTRLRKKAGIEWSRGLQKSQEFGYAFGRLAHRWTRWNYGEFGERTGLGADHPHVRHMAGAGYLAETDALDAALEQHTKEFDGEDMQTAALLQFTGDETISYFPDLVVKTDPPDTVCDLIIQRKGWHHGAAHVYYEHARDYLGELWDGWPKAQQDLPDEELAEDEHSDAERRSAWDTVPKPRIDKPLNHYTLYETVFMSGIAPVLAAGVAYEAANGNLAPAAAWYVTDGIVTGTGLGIAHYKDELEDPIDEKKDLAVLAAMPVYRATAFFPGKLASYPEFIRKTGGEALHDAWDGLTDRSPVAAQTDATIAQYRQLREKHRERTELTPADMGRYHRKETLTAEEQDAMADLEEELQAIEAEIREERSAYHDEIGALKDTITDRITAPFRREDEENGDDTTEKDDDDEYVEDGGTATATDRDDGLLDSVVDTAASYRDTASNYLGRAKDHAENAVGRYQDRKRIKDEEWRPLRTELHTTISELNNPHISNEKRQQLEAQAEELKAEITTVEDRLDSVGSGDGVEGDEHRADGGISRYDPGDDPADYLDTALETVDDALAAGIRNGLVDRYQERDGLFGLDDEEELQAKAVDLYGDDRPEAAGDWDDARDELLYAQLATYGEELSDEQQVDVARAITDLPYDEPMADPATPDGLRDRATSYVKDAASSLFG